MSLYTLIRFALLCAGLACLDLFPKSDPQPGRKVRARVVAVDNTDVEEFGLLKKGSQLLEVEILGGRWKGQRFRAANILRAQMELDKLFDRFYRGDSARTQKNGGYGIGLSVAQSIVQLHKGSIGAESGEDFLAFKIRLPIS